MKTLDLLTVIQTLKPRVNQDNGLSNADAEYMDDIEEALRFHVNPDANTTITIDKTDPELPVFAGTPEVDEVLFSMILLRTEIVILERKYDLDVELAVSADTPRGRMNTTHRPENRLKRIERRETQYQRYLAIFLNGLELGTSQFLDINTTLLGNREVPIETTL